jgi:DNA repair protein RecN (Recombination protein N)
LTGAKADSGSVGPADDTAQADGLVVSDVEVGVSRVIPKDGRSRSHLDGTIVSSDTLADRIGTQIEIVGQHDQLSLRRQSHVLSLIDGALDEKGHKAKDSYITAWAHLDELRRRQDLLGGDEGALRRELDLVRYQAREIAESGFERGAEIELEAGAARLRNSEEILEHLGETAKLVESIIDQGGVAVSRLRKASEMDAALSGLTNDMEAVAAHLAELATGLRQAVEEVDLDPSHLEEMEQRLTLLGELKRKYGRTLDEVLAFGADAAKRVDELEGLLADSSRLETEITEAEGRVATTASALSKVRRSTASALSERTQGHLADLAMKRATVEYRLEPVPPGPSGADRAGILFSSDSGLEPGPVNKVASGGELSRLVLAARLATHDEGVATLVFDEIDAGVGGATALALGRKLAELSKATQVLCVTHLPQVAAHADTHYVVERDGSTAFVRRVEQEERVTEISRMLAGLPESDAGQRAARELLVEASS